MRTGFLDFLSEYAFSLSSRILAASASSWEYKKYVVLAKPQTTIFKTTSVHSLLDYSQNTYTLVNL